MVIRSLFPASLARFRVWRLALMAALLVPLAGQAATLEVEGPDGTSEHLQLPDGPVPTEVSWSTDATFHATPFGYEAQMAETGVLGVNGTLEWTPTLAPLSPEKASPLVQLVAAIPEPASAGLIALGTLAVLLGRRRRQANAPRENDPMFLD